MVLNPQMVPLSLAGRDEAPSYTTKLRQISNSVVCIGPFLAVPDCERDTLRMDPTAVGIAV